MLFEIPGRTETKPEIEFGFLEIVILKISWDGLSCQQMNDCEGNELEHVDVSARLLAICLAPGKQNVQRGNCESDLAKQCFAIIPIWKEENKHVLSCNCPIIWLLQY